MEQNATILMRDQIDIKNTWALEDLFTSDEAWEKELELLDEDKAKLMACEGTLGSGADALLAFLKLTEDTQVRVSKLANYCMRKSDEDTTNSKYQAVRSVYYYCGCFGSGNEL